MARYWGFWTRGKLELLQDYLRAFVLASAGRAQEIIYLDLFGGQPDNRERLTDADLVGSARIALDLKEPGFTRLRFFELEPQAQELQRALLRDYPDRDFEVVPGDCNKTIGAALRELHRVNWAPTFAFVDPNGPDVTWSTLHAISTFKTRDRTKAEIWLLFAAGMFTRTLRKDGSVREIDADKLDRVFGTDQWRAIYGARVADRLQPGSARDEYVNLMRWRLEHVLGYTWTHPLEIFNEGGSSIYHMIFATDHPVGNKIMSDLYARAAERFPQMRAEARQRRARIQAEASGMHSLFGEELDELARPLAAGERFYEHQSPDNPYGAG